MAMTWFADTFFVMEKKRENDDWRGEDVFCNLFFLQIRLEK